MAKVKYYYDSETLSYRKVETKKSKLFFRSMLFILLSFCFGLVLFLFADSFLASPELKKHVIR
jgi:uncharacterized membrane protein (DUF485 family)